jgi:hypothetical protein
LRSVDAFSPSAVGWLTEKGNPMAVVYYRPVLRAVICPNQRVFDNQAADAMADEK